MKSLKPANILSLIAAVLYFALTTGIVCFFCFQYRFSFNYELDINDHYHLVFVFPVAFAVGALKLWAANSCLSVPQILFLIILSLFSLLILLSRYYNWGNEHFSVVISVMASAGLIVFFDAKCIIHLFCLSLCLLFVYELYLGWLQYLEAIDFAKNISLEVTGSFQNSGVFSMYLVSQLPIFFFIVTQYGSQRSVVNRKWNTLRFLLFSFVLAATLFLVYKTQSRSAYVATGILIIGWLLFESSSSTMIKLKRISKKWLYILGMLFLVLVTVGGCCLFAMKRASAFGRLMKLSITSQHLGDHLLTGTGLGRFSWYYPQWQATYFSMLPQPPKSFFLSAGESYIIFNEPLQMFVETGLPVFLLFVMALLYFFTIRSVKYHKLLMALKLTVIVLLASSFTSYPLHVNYLLWFFSFCIFSAFMLDVSPSFFFFFKPIFLQRYKWPFGLAASIALFVLGMVSLNGIKVYEAFRQWREQQDGVARNLGSYSLLKRNLNSNGKFLTDYATALLEEGKANQAVQLMEEAEFYFISRQTKELLINANTANNDLIAAIREQTWLCNYLPNKFSLKYELLEMYLKNKDTLKAKQVALTILTMPVKIPSVEVDRFKAGALQVIRSIN